MTKISISVTSDTVCPWCYVGRRQLQRAQGLWLQQDANSGDSFSVTFVPYQLEPTWPQGPDSSRNKQQFYNGKFGPQHTRLIQQRLENIGSQLGINFRWGGRIGNSKDSHRLIHLAKSYGNSVELAVVDGLFAAYFEKEQDITSHDILRHVATRAGIPAQDFQDAIVHGDKGGAEVDEATTLARSSGVTGVPFFNIQSRFHVSGALDAKDFLKIFQKVKAHEGGSPVSDTELD
ncbi:hypothetical protein CDD82_4866 [Ophiocordyceps australis]|uniref:DSBA-like thioredoxin domain-containing protein n=1 Tax=Ophiocordyceps australis TaxID=1399860 RepID=A0A2C5YYF6_9HYPO|nr:hypothetical protein CDD82_4866 [Ophiocordyceps australis]